MIKRTIYISNPAYLSTELEQMVIREPKKKEEKGRVHIEDLGMLLLEHRQITLTHGLISKLLEHNVVVVSCNDSHMPNGLMLSTTGHSEMTLRWRHQIEATKSLKKQLWQQTVDAKIRNQAMHLKIRGKPTESLEKYRRGLKSGDESNMEGKAAKYYWKHLSPNFVRDPKGDPPNAHLNFGYAILRAIVARAIVSSGLLLASGIFHRNKYNPFCLADDIMEPYRPYVDRMVFNWKDQFGEAAELSKHFRVDMLQLPTEDVVIDEKKRPLMVAVSTTTASLAKCFEGTKRKISYPKIQ